MEHISTGSFRNCKSLRKIRLPESARYIYERAFNGCTALKSITVPAGVVSITKHAIGFSYEHGEMKRIAGFVLRGPPGSAAEAYAAQSGIAFEPV